MQIIHLKEPLLEFGLGEHVDPKTGIYTFHPYDLNQVHPESIRTGMIGKSDSVDKIVEWIENGKKPIAAKKTKLIHLFPAFCGFNREIGFKSQVVYDEGYIRKINNSEFERVIKQAKDENTLNKDMVELYLSEIRFLAKNKKPDVILCVISENFFDLLNKSPSSEEEQVTTPRDEIDAEAVLDVEHNFRRMLKAASMQYNIPIQIVRDRIVKPTGEMQDAATIAWNFYTALYYKAAGTPWALKKKTNTIVCYAGISFYKSRDRKTIQTSVTQIFNEHGKGVILRGSPIEMKKGDRVPHLSERQAYELMDKSLKEYYEALKIFPRRLVLHKSSNYNQAELEGFKAVYVVK